MSRICNKKDYRLDANLTLQPGDEIFVNFVGMHFDPGYFPNPDKFNPENFSREAIFGRFPGAFNPFGAGPRSCIGLRFAYYEIKMVMAALLRNCIFYTCKETVMSKPALNPAAPNGAALDPGLRVRIKMRNVDI